MDPRMLKPSEEVSVVEAVDGRRVSESPSLRALFGSFLRLGVTAFGGPAMVAYIRDLAVRKNHWVSSDSFADGTALCQSIPGATAMQAAAYVGLRARGAIGALATFVGFGLPAFILMTILSVVYAGTRDLQPVASAFRGLHVIVVALVANAVVNFGRSTIRNWRDAILAFGAGAFLFGRGSPILAILASAGVGMILYHGVNLPIRSLHADAQPGGRHALRPVIWAILAGGAVLAVLFVTNRRFFDLAALMIKVDLFAFGGGFASVPVMLHQVVDVRHWMDSKTFMDGIALGQVTPGPIVITATFVGYEVAGLAGALTGTVAVFTPSFLMVLITVPYFDRLQHSVLFRRALRGILASFVGLLLAVTVQFAIAASWTVQAIFLAVASFAALWFKIDILWVVLVGAGVSIFIL
jgi:chromate transporter